MKNIMAKLSVRKLTGIGALLLTLLTVGCLETTGDQIGSFLDDVFKVYEPQVVVGKPIQKNQVVWHIQSTVAATILRLQGDDGNDIDSQLDIVGSAGIEQDLNTDLKGFAIANILINDFFHPEDAPSVYRLGARLVLQDATTRRVGVSFIADYELVDGKVVLKGHAWEYAPSILPVTETYVVAAADFDALDAEKAKIYSDFRSHVLTNAIDVGNLGNAPKRGDFVIVTFMMDKIQADDSFELAISDVKEGPDGFADDSQYILHDNGWVTGVVPGTFSLTANEAFWIKAVYTTAGSSKRVIGLFNTANLSSSAS
ncbi:MAG: hypothetical protein V7701_14255 [Sneathiella sp.]